MISTLELACMPWYMRAVTPKMMAVMHGRSRSLQYWCQRRITTLAAHFIVPSAQRHMAAILVERLNPACLFRLAALCAGKPPSAGKPPAGKAGKPGGKAGSAAEAPLPGEAAGPPRACVGELEAAAALWAPDLRSSGAGPWEAGVVEQMCSVLWRACVTSQPSAQRISPYVPASTHGTR